MMQSPLTAQALYDKLKHVTIGVHTCLFTYEKCEALLPAVNRINALKAEKNAVILAHSYVAPEIIHAVADFVGDSYELSKKAQSVSADTIVFSAVKFMAETAKLLNPSKTVLVPSKDNGCSLADSITGEQVRHLRTLYPDYTFICYINTSAEVKAQCDICVTSSNVYDIMAKHPNQNIYFLPDKLMGQNVQKEMERRGILKNIQYWNGVCYVHEAYDPDMIRFIKHDTPDVHVLAHPECSPDVLEQADYVGSTSQMIKHVQDTDYNAYFLLTECGLTGRLQTENPGKKFLGTCTMCKFMKSNKLADIIRVLENPDTDDRIEIESDTANKARQCIEAMFEWVAK